MIALKDEWIRAGKTGNPYVLQRFKSALAAYDPAQAFDVFRQALHLDDGAVLSPALAKSMQAAAKGGAKIYMETGAAGQSFINRSPRVIGQNNSRDLIGRNRTAYLACFEDCRVWNKCNAIEWNNEILLDFEDWELLQI